MKKKTKSQAIFKRQKFDYAQYWLLNYTTICSDSTKKYYKAFIKAKSYFLAKEILRMKLIEDGGDEKLKSQSIYGDMMHAKYRMNQQRLTIEDWANIKQSAFPNAANILFKMEVPPPKKVLSLNPKSTANLINVGFKKGKDNWNANNTTGKSLPMEERSHKIFRGKWMDWEPELREAQKDKLIGALLKHDHNRTKAAEELNLGRNGFYGLMKKFPEVDWNKKRNPYLLSK